MPLSRPKKEVVMDYSRIMKILNSKNKGHFFFFMICFSIDALEKWCPIIFLQIYKSITCAGITCCESRDKPQGNSRLLLGLTAAQLAVT